MFMQKTHIFLNSAQKIGNYLQGILDGLLRKREFIGSIPSGDFYGLQSFFGDDLILKDFMG